MAEQTQAHTKVTTDHDEIRRWVEEHGGRPAVVRDTREDGEGDGKDSTFFKLTQR
jgi:hypothetical protein